MAITLEWWQLLGATLAAVLSSAMLVALVNQLFTRQRVAAETKKLDAEAQKIDVDAGDVIVGNWQELWCQMLARIHQMEDRLDRERTLVTQLEEQVKGLREDLGARIVQDAQREAELVKLRSEASSKDGQISALNSRVQELEETVRALSRRMKDLCTENERLRHGQTGPQQIVAGGDTHDGAVAGDAAGQSGGGPDPDRRGGAD